MLEAPTDRRSDPRALRYIVDHLPPGTTIKRQLLIVNRTDETRRVDVYPGAATLETSAFRFGEGRAANELTSWTTLDERAVELEPWGEARVRATITVPPAASRGERYGVIWASTSSAPRAGGEITQVHRVGVRMYLDIGPGGEPASDFSIGELRPARSPEGEPSVSVQVRNTGGRAVDLTGTVSLTDGPAGSRAGPFRIGQGVTLAPGAAGQVIARFPVELPNGPWKAEVNLESGLVKRSLTAQVQFPDAGQVGKRGSVVSRIMSGWALGAAVAGLLLVTGLAVLARGSRRSGRPPADRPRERIRAGA
ncbi:hypothetical protein LADH09A_006277 [Micromonospora sp. LAH09]|uniref:hypothetical protein n=1 Tax=Micromonospora cabrerizensis TaxID=2911213 RepID=UPI001EE920D6|nr:hypothetical protein [Micromonospora cabrerizensis]MCG5472239.1 hypothetical protein [Micromonospora cabrerizensis]